MFFCVVGSFTAFFRIKASRINQIILLNKETVCP
jgi:hypothetical protein